MWGVEWFKMAKNYKKEKIPTDQDLNDILDLEIPDDVKRDFYFFYKEVSKGKFKKNTERIKSEYFFNSKLNNKIKSDNEIKGLYILFNDMNNPVYIGISQTIIRRLRQHFLGTEHNQSTLCYLMAREEHKDKDLGKNNQRKNFPYIKYRDRIQKNMRDTWKIAIIPETNNYLLYYKEIYYSCLLKTKWNSFETH